MKINGRPHTLTPTECCSIANVLHRYRRAGSNTDFRVELSVEEEGLLSEIAGDDVGNAIYRSLRASLGLAVKLRWTYQNCVFTSTAV